jgi:hypothetical protein
LPVSRRSRTYARLLRCRTARRIRIGRRGVLHLRPGRYVYVGSAFGGCRRLAPVEWRWFCGFDEMMKVA